MINTIVINFEPQTDALIKQKINDFCPGLKVCGSVASLKDASKLIKDSSPALAFIDINIPKTEVPRSFYDASFSNLETIFLSDSIEDAFDAFRYHACGFILKPIQIPELISAVKKARKRIEFKKKYVEHQKIISQLTDYTPPGNLIGIPTFEGFDFIHVKDIIRCIGMQKCTRIIFEDRAELISSYNIGEFVKLLEPFYFFSPHKSHLINLIHVKKYYKEGTIKMVDGSCVPVSKRRKSMFLKRMLLSR